MNRPSRIVIVTAFTSLASVIAAHGQTFIRSYGSATESAYPYAVDATRDGGYVLAGEVIAGGGGRDLYVSKLYPSGNLAWTRRYATGSDDIVHSIQQTSDGGYVLAAEEGYFAGHIGGQIERDFWVLKLDATGSIEWQKIYGGADQEYVEVARQTRDGGYIVAGSTVSFAFAGTIDAWVIKLDASGSIVWQKAYGGPGTEHIFALEETDDGGFALAGYTNSYGAGQEDMWVVRIDADGAIVWQRAYGGAAYERAYAIVEARDGTGDFMVGGTTNSFGGIADDLFLLRIHSDGTLVWNRRYDGSVNAISQGDTLRGLAWMPDNTVLLAATKPTVSNGSDVWLLKIDNGTTVWEKTYGGSSSDAAYAVRPIAGTGGVIVAGTTASFGQVGVAAAWALRLDGSGAVGGGCTLPASASVTGRPTLATSIPTSAAVADTASGSATVTLTEVPLTETVYDECIGKPSEVSHAYASQPLGFTDRTTLQWEAALVNGATTFNVYRGTLAGLPAQDYGSCFASGLTAPTVQDPASPAAGAGWTYLVTGKNAAGEGSLGTKSDGAERPNGSPCP